MLPGWWVSRRITARTVAATLPDGPSQAYWSADADTLVLVLIFAAAASALTGEWVDAAIVVVIVLTTVSIGYTREYQAETAAAALQARVRTQARVLREKRAVDVPLEEVVPGDVMLLAAGSLVPA